MTNVETFVLRFRAPLRLARGNFVKAAASGISWHGFSRSRMRRLEQKTFLNQRFLLTTAKEQEPGKTPFNGTNLINPNQEIWKKDRIYSDVLHSKDTQREPLKELDTEEKSGFALLQLRFG